MPSGLVVRAGPSLRARLAVPVAVHARRPRLAVLFVRLVVVLVMRRVCRRGGSGGTAVAVA